jgi:hypothetical protein
MAESRDYLEMAFRSIQCFSNDGVLNADELKKIVAIAQRDGVVDDNEKRILRSIVAKLTPADLNDEMRQAVADLRLQFNL